MACSRAHVELFEFGLRKLESTPAACSRQNFALPSRYQVPGSPCGGMKSLYLGVCQQARSTERVRGHHYSSKMFHGFHTLISCDQVCATGHDAVIFEQNCIVA
jgi:hypothetical protein